MYILHLHTLCGKMVQPAFDLDLHGRLLRVAFFLHHSHYHSPADLLVTHTSRTRLALQKTRDPPQRYPLPPELLDDIVERAILEHIDGPLAMRTAPRPLQQGIANTDEIAAMKLVLEPMLDADPAPRERNPITNRRSSTDASQLTIRSSSGAPDLDACSD